MNDVSETITVDNVVGSWTIEIPHDVRVKCGGETMVYRNVPLVDSEMTLYNQGDKQVLVNLKGQEKKDANYILIRDKKNGEVSVFAEEGAFHPRKLEAIISAITEGHCHDL